MTVRAHWTPSGIRQSDIPSSWWQAQTTLGKNDSKYLGGGKNTKTSLLRYANGDPDNRDDFAVRLKFTNVVTFHPDGELTLRSGGYETKTTKQRINEALPGKWRLGSHRITRNKIRRSEWWLHYAGQPIMKFEDGMRFDPDNKEIRGGLI